MPSTDDGHGESPEHEETSPPERERTPEDALDEIRRGLAAQRARLTETQAALEAQIRALDQHLELLNAKLDALSANRVGQPERSAPPREGTAMREHTGKDHQATPPPLPPQAPASALPTAPRSTAPRQGQGPIPVRESLETTLGANWINRIAVVTLILGAAFLFRYGVENGWLGPTERVILGLVSGLISLAAGERLQKRGLKYFAQGISGLGIALFYLAFWAAARLYDLIPTAGGLIGMSAVTVLAEFLALRYASQAVAALGMIGGYLTPAVLSSGEDRPWVLFSYLALLNQGGLTVAKMRRWIPLEAMAVAATALYVLATMDTSQAVAETPWLAAGFLAFFYAQFWLTYEGVWAAAQLVFPASVYMLWTTGHIADFWQIPFVAAGLAAAGTRRQSFPYPPGAALWTLIATSLIFFAGAPGEPTSIWLRFLCLTILFLLFLAWTPWRTLWRTTVRKVRPEPVDLLVLAGAGSFYFATSYPLLESVQPEPRGALAFALAVLYLGLSRVLAPREPNGSPAAQAGTSQGGAQFSTAQLSAEEVALVAGGAFLTLAIPIQFAGFRISMAWALEGAALAWLGARYRHWLVTLGSLIVIALTVAHIGLFDAWIYRTASEYSTIVNLRLLTMATGAVGVWFAAYFHNVLARSIGGKDDPPGIVMQIPALIEYLAGHVLLLLAFSLEVIGWVDRSFTDNIRSVTTMSLSILYTTYAAILVAAGVQMRQRLHRIVGLALIAAVVAKLYVYDVWILGRLFRILAFLALGGLLLAVSYLYSRYRHLLDRFLERDSEPAP